MTKSELISAMAERAGITKAQAAEALNAVTDALTGVGATGGSLTLTGFGTFRGKLRPARTGRNPATGGAVEIAEKRTLTFKASAALKI